MTYEPSRRWARCAVGIRARAKLADPHRDRAEDFLRRHEIESHGATPAPSRTQTPFAACLYSRLTDNRNLYLATQYVREFGGNAAGPDGLRPREIPREAIGGLARAIQHCLRDGYHRGPTRQHQIEGGQRTIQVHNVVDRIVDRATSQIITPLLHPRTGLTMARTGLGAHTALSILHTMIRHQQPKAIISQDIRSAFDHVPRGRLMGILRHHGLSDELTNLTSELIGGTTGIGIPQGLACSPLLMDVYVGHMIARPLRRHGIKCMSYLDDLIIWANGDQMATYQRLQDTLRQAGFVGKYGPDRALVIPGEPFDYLGYKLTAGADHLHIDIADGWTSLRQNLTATAMQDEGQTAINTAIRGWVNYMGPARRAVSTKRLYETVQDMCAQIGYPEIPSRARVEGDFDSAYERWLYKHRRVWSILGDRLAQGSAHGPIVNDLVFDCAAGAQVAPACSTPRRRQPQYRLFTDGCWDSSLGRGGWAFCLVSIDETVFGSDSHPHTTNRRMQLMAVLNGLRQIPDNASVEIITDSDNVYRALTRHIGTWAHWQWRNRFDAGLRRLPHARLWRRIYQELQRLDAECDWVCAQSGIYFNEIAGRFARQAIAERRNRIIWAERPDLLAQCAVRGPATLTQSESTPHPGHRETSSLRA